MATLTTNIFLPLQKETNYLINHLSRGRVVVELPQSGQVACVILCPFCSMHGYTATLVKFNQKYLRITISQKSCMSFSKPLFFWFPELLPIFG